MYNICIQYLDIIGVNISGKNNLHPSVIPAELCQVIPGQLYKQKVPEYLTAKVVDFTKIKLQDCFRKITQSIHIFLSDIVCVMTQCLWLEKFMATNNQYWNNVVLNCNSSKSGVLTGLQKESFMIIVQQDANLVCMQGVFHMSPEVHSLQFDDSASSSSSGLLFNLDNWHNITITISSHVCMASILYKIS
ncbi:hypothetical protein BYT27DRAFT_7301310 [Phlegmacium glaucopus]|nr:hypothetical protein BYT27DRAFT_7301310 [Phlegmacium glaucopus]